MKVLVCGDRTWGNVWMIREWLRYLNPSEVLEGGARGADRIAGEAARELNIPVRVFPAEWDKYGRAAGPIRNRQMLDECPDLVVAFHSNIESSSGTADTLCEAERRGMDYVLVPEE